MTLKKIALLLMLTAAFACKKKEEETTTETPVDSTPAADGTQTMAALAGDGQYCEVTTSLGGTFAITRYLSMTSSGTYSYSLYLSDSTSCATTQNAGGNNYATYTQSGTFTLNGAANISGSGTKITFVPTAQSMIIRTGTYTTRGAALATWMNTCSYSPGYSTTANDTKTLNQHVCTASNNFSAVDFAVNSASYTNVVYKNGTTLQMGTPSSFSPWTPAGTSVPTSFSNTYLGW